MNIYQQCLSLQGPWHPAVLIAAAPVLPGDSGTTAAKWEGSGAPGGSAAQLVPRKTSSRRWCSCTHTYISSISNRKQRTLASIQSKSSCYSQYVESVILSSCKTVSLRHIREHNCSLDRWHSQQNKSIDQWKNSQSFVLKSPLIPLSICVQVLSTFQSQISTSVICKHGLMPTRI